jgi:hypothetical protein
MSKQFFNGMEIGKVYISKARPKKKDNGHSMVEVRTVVNTRWVTRRTIVCQCGKSMSGNGSRAFYSHTAHVKEATQ